MVLGKGSVSEHIKRSMCQVPVAEHRHQCRFIDQSTARGIHQDGMRLHQLQSRCGEKALRFRRERQMQLDDVGSAEKFFQCGGLAWRIPTDRVTVPRENTHAEAAGDPGNGAADVTHADDAEDLTFQFYTGQGSP